jgi:uncharacterized membrane protein YfcA
VRWRAGLAFAAAAAPAALGGTALNRVAGSSEILLAFGVLLLVAAGAMATGRRGRDAAAPRPLRVVAAGGVTGLLTGFFGVGGGFVIVPALVFALGLPMTAAVGTSLLVIALTSSAALGAHLASGGIALAVAAPFAAAAVVGAVLGTRLHGRVPERALRIVFAALLAGIATFLIARNAAALA